MATRVLYAEDNALLRDGVARLLSTSDDIELVGCCASFDDVIAALPASDPQIVITDIRMPPTHTDEGIRLACALRSSHPDVGVIVLSQHADPSFAHRLLEGGSARRAYLLKDRVADPEQLIGTVRTVAAGGSVIDPMIVEELVTLRTRQKTSQLNQLTAREGDVLREMAQGHSNAAIASRLGLSERAVEKHSNTIFAKLHLTEEPDINRRVKAVLVYLANSA